MLKCSECGRLGAQTYKARLSGEFECIHCGKWSSTYAIPLNRLSTDQKIVAERQWQRQRRKLAPKPQQACDHGLFSDDANQMDLLDLIRAK